MDLRQRMFDRMVEELTQAIPADPAEANRVMLQQQREAIVTMTAIQALTGIPMSAKEEMESFRKFTEAQLRAFKSKVEEALLASQAETNRNLAAALGMRDKS